MLENLFSSKLLLRIDTKYRSHVYLRMFAVYRFTYPRENDCVCMCVYIHVAKFMTHTLRRPCMKTQGILRVCMCNCTHSYHTLLCNHFLSLFYLIFVRASRYLFLKSCGTCSFIHACLCMFFFTVNIFSFCDVWTAVFNVTFEFFLSLSLCLILMCLRDDGCFSILFT